MGISPAPRAGSWWPMRETGPQFSLSFSLLGSQGSPGSNHLWPPHLLQFSLSLSPSLSPDIWLSLPYIHSRKWSPCLTRSSANSDSPKSPQPNSQIPRISWTSPSMGQMPAHPGTGRYNQAGPLGADHPGVQVGRQAFGPYVPANP